MSRLESVKAITLDLYGTVLDLESSMLPAFGEFLSTKGYSGDPRDVIRAWQTAYFQEMMIDTLLAHGRTPFEGISRSCLSGVLAAMGIPHTATEAKALIASRARGEVFPDVKDGLEQLGGRYTLAVLSNGDLDALRRTVANLALSVQQIISAEQAGVYKPHPAVYREGAARLGLQPGEVLHVAAHAWDIRGAVASGMHGAYVNRGAEPFGESPFQPDVEASDLLDLAARLP